MFLDQQVPDECKVLWQQCRDLIPQFLKNAPVIEQSVTIASNEKLDVTKYLYHVQEGIVDEYFQGKLIMSYQDGDLIAGDNLFAEKACEYSSDFAIIVDIYDKQSLIKHIQNTPEKNNYWNLYNTYLSQSFHILTAHFNKQQTSIRPEMREYSKGDTIIHEGATDTEVFTLLSGSAQVTSAGVVVGDIKTDEIFGAIAALTGTRRTASVIATTDCTALVVQSQHFKTLISVRPDTVTKLIEDMARTVVSCNKKIINLSN